MFYIEQIALCPEDAQAAKSLLSEMIAFNEALKSDYVEVNHDGPVVADFSGSVEWHSDVVMAEGYVRVNNSQLIMENVAHLDFNYQFTRPEAMNTPVELELLDYRHGRNWMESAPHSVSHLGCHCTAEELRHWRDFFYARNIPVAQEVETKSHTNPHIADSRRYHYCIFGTRQILGVDIKFIVRKPIS